MQPSARLYLRDAIEISLSNLSKFGSFSAGQFRRDRFTGIPGNAVVVVNFLQTRVAVERGRFGLVFISHFSPDEPIASFSNLDEEESGIIVAAIFGMGYPSLSHFIFPIQQCIDAAAELADNIHTRIVSGAVERRAQHLIILPNSGYIALTNEHIVGTVGNRDSALELYNKMKG